MTTTYALNGLKAVFGDSDAESDVFSETTLLLTLPDEVETVRYEVLPGAETIFDTEVVFPDLPEDALSFDDTAFDDLFLDNGGTDVEILFMQINWSGGTTYTLEFYFNNSAEGADVGYVFTFGDDLGFPLSDRTTLATFGINELSPEARAALFDGDTPSQELALAELQEIFTVPAAPYAPETDIALGAFPWDSVTDNGEGGPVDITPPVVETGDNDPDLLEGRSGNDTLDGGRGDDTLDGGAGDDDLKAGVGEDSVDGGAGSDFIRGGRGEDTLNGDAGDDSIVGQRNADTLNGGSGDDTLKGGGGNDLLNGGSGDDFLKGGTRRDTLNGGEGNDRLVGNSFDDVLNGGAGNDNLNAGGDNDALNGGTGNDTLKGGAGEDVFIFEAGMDADLLQDFELGVDFLEISSALTGGLTDGADVVAAFEDGNRLDFGGGNVITFENLGSLTGLGDDITVF